MQSCFNGAGSNGVGAASKNEREAGCWCASAARVKGRVVRISRVGREQRPSG
jgi:hypothetical protein